MSKERKLNNQPDSNEIWAGIGGHFDSLGQIIAEFVDNSIANIMATGPLNRDISVRLIDLQTAVRVQIENPAQASTAWTTPSHWAARRRDLARSTSTALG